MSCAAIPAVRPFWGVVIATAVAAAVALALTAGSAAADPELALVLRFMAVVKAAMALCAAALATWRVARAVRPAAALGYVTAVSSMAAGAALIWQLQYVGTGALMVHGGLAALAVVAWLDRAGWAQAASAIPASMRSSRKGWPGASRSPYQPTPRPSP